MTRSGRPGPRWTGDPADVAALDLRGPAGVLPARLPVTDLAVAAVAAAGLAALELARVRGLPAAGPLPVDSRAVTVAFTSERHLRLAGRSFAGFAPLSRFWPAADGWVRTHGNYPHHRQRLLGALGLDPAQDESDALTAAVADRIRDAPALDVEERVTAAGGLAIAVRTPAGWDVHPQAAAVASEPLVRLRLDGPAASRRLPRPPGGLPAAGVRVLDLTRATDRGRFDEPLAGADVVVTGYLLGACRAPCRPRPSSTAPGTWSPRRCSGQRPAGLAAGRQRR